MRVTSHPPHRSVHAAFPHTVPTSGIHGDCAPYASQRLCDAYPVLSPVRALPARVPLGLRPSPHRLRSGWPRRGLLRSGSLRLVRRLHSYYGGARLLVPVHHRLRLLVFPMRTVPLPRQRPTVTRNPSFPPAPLAPYVLLCPRTAGRRGGKVLRFGGSSKKKIKKPAVCVTLC